MLEFLIPAVESANQAELLAVSSLACGLVGIGSCNGQVTNAILSKLVDVRESESLKAPHMRLVVLGTNHTSSTYIDYLIPSVLQV